jgi:hypothetical protein
VGSYSATITIPVLTLQTAPIRLPMQLREQVIVHWEVFFPTGCRGLVYVSIFEDTHRIIPDPASLDNWLHGEGPIDWSGTMRLSTGQPLGALLDIRGYSDANGFDHHPIIRIDTA